MGCVRERGRANGLLQCTELMSLNAYRWNCGQVKQYNSLNTEIKGLKRMFDPHAKNMLHRTYSFYIFK